MKTCLLVIDAQQSFRNRPYSSERDMPAYLAFQNALIAGCTARGVPVVRVLHVDGSKSKDNPFAIESSHVVPLEGLANFTPAAAFVKGRHSALIGTGLEVWLTQQGIQRLIISGIRTEQCCETTTRHASDLGWEVDFVLSATLTWDMQLLSCSPLSAADIKARTAAVLTDRFATICSVEQALDRAGTAL